ncbi:hypothetical protein BT93_H1298 [Corymbia citriodora subsp. variegata]|nr:hypothetical protein BT93_H1298 [Corymbia citriodora subsp. variegata]
MTKRSVLKPTLPRWDFRPWLLTKLAQRGSQFSPPKQGQATVLPILHRSKRSTVTSNNRIPEPGLQVRQLQ